MIFLICVLSLDFFLMFFLTLKWQASFTYWLFLSQSLKSCVSEGIQAVDDRMTKQEDIRRKKVQQIVLSLKDHP